MSFPLLIIVPARGGSRRLPRKNVMKLAGKTLLEYTADAISQAGLEAPVILTTDDDEIAQEGERLGWTVPFRRPASLSHDTAPTIDAVIHSLDWFRDENGGDPAATLVLQPTSPLRGGACLKLAIETLRSRSDIDSIVSMTAIHVPPAFLYGRDENGTGIPVGQDHQPRQVFYPNGALYLTRTKNLRDENTLYAGHVMPLELGRLQSIDIDTESDFLLAEAIIAAGILPGEFHHNPAASGPTED